MNHKTDPYATKLHKRIDALLFVFILVVIAVLLRPVAKGEMPLAVTFSTVRPFWSTLAIFTSPADSSLGQFQGQYDGVGAADRAALTALFSAPASSKFSPMMVVENHRPTSAVVANLDSGSHAKSFSSPSSLAPLSQISGYGSALTAESLNAPAFRTGTALAGTDSRETSPALAGAIDAGPRYAGEADAAPFIASTSSASSQANQTSVTSSNGASSYSLQAASAPIVSPLNSLDNADKTSAPSLKGLSGPTAPNAINATTTYTMQTGNFNANFGAGGGFHGYYNNGGSELGMYANSAGDSSFAAFETFNTTGNGNSGTARAFQVGDSFSITNFISASPSSRVGISLRSSTSYTSFSSVDSNVEAKFQLDSSGGWKVFSSGFGSGQDSSRGAGQDVTFTFTLTSSNTFNISITRVTTGGSFDLYDLGTFTGAQITSLGLFIVNSSNDTFWKNATLTNTGAVTLGAGNGTSNDLRYYLRRSGGK